ncbi:MAG TPA: SDR family oxidoreductase [Verrucomicrobiae bacterium]|nr:SDR family oxidoreductase [Verrucomicrobiae bacterium]
MSDQKVVMVTGSSSGIGREISLLLARNNYVVYAGMRNLEKSSKLKSMTENENLDLRILHLDVNDDESVKNALDYIYAKSSRLDVLINNAGYGLRGAFEDLDMGEIKSLYETNVFGYIRTIQSALPIMRKQQSGLIINISSGVGRFGIPNASAYSSSKFAVEGLSESLFYEVEPFGIKVVLVEPGVIKTNFFNSLVISNRSVDPASPYTQMMREKDSGLNEMIKNGSEPEYVAKIVLDIISNDNPNLRYLAGKDIEQIMELKKRMSDIDFHNMMKKM